LFENQEATSPEQRTLDPTDFYATIKYLLKLRNIGAVDDIDHLATVVCARQDCSRISSVSAWSAWNARSKR
jgi:hypothetical protein